MNIDYTYRARLHRIVDADTFVLNTDLGFNVWAHITVRLRGVNAPERGAPGGPEATEWVRGLIGNADLYVRSYKDRMTFARWICDVGVIDGVMMLDLAEAMIEAGHAEKYIAK